MFFLGFICEAVSEHYKKKAMSVIRAKFSPNCYHLIPLLIWRVKSDEGFLDPDEDIDSGRKSKKEK